MNIKFYQEMNLHYEVPPVATWLTQNSYHYHMLGSPSESGDVHSS